ncbi:FTR1 family iron permease [Pleomorphomonas diazotrophica]|uniref:FTR1 family iron permease n=1 Tax=Pleomorphomonas diazotrophica TaxID=1166257 RepID=A0A1I4S7H4_9HYPH|nr:FTR1 family protein [Pleomorphomonas diazotrophica]PKR89889.1 FTR1 family iron permease [Pleomorphomonas diazotrophica]SFM60458.1 high-affinity iron transporter [Pleomorphomonas diazotrophica]
MFGSIAFVVWRESVEALLVIGILDAWLRAETRDTGRARLYLWGGVAAGLAFAGLLAALLVRLGDAISEEAQLAYTTGMVLIAAVLILQMVFWMRKHGRSMKRDLEAQLSIAVIRRSWWGVFVLALVAVAREGSETVIFLYGILSSGAAGDLVSGVGAGLFGFALALLSYGLLQAGSRLLSWRLFFRITEIMLLFLACALLMTGIDGLIDLEILPRLSRRLWDSGWLLSDGDATGGFISALTGYRATPNLMELLVFVGYWALVLFVIFRPKRPVAPVLA